MLFNSYEFLFVFLPVTLIVFTWLNRRHSGRSAVAFLGAASILFYGWYDYRHVAVIAVSIAVNWLLGREIERRRSRGILTAAVGANLIALGYYKYAGFLSTVLQEGTGFDTGFAGVALPLGISFFTFTQIAFLVDCYRGQAKERGLLNYVLFVTFFPHLIAGPVLHHKEMMPQFAALQGRRPESRMVAFGLFLLAIGLFKKVVIADTLAKYVDPAFANVDKMEIMDAWTATLGYTLQLYFDFSAYSEIAMGIAMLFGVVLPLNFYSPYKACDIADFWKRWHMTLSRFLRDYLYIPLGGNRHGNARMFMALGATMVLGGIWHGAGWQFVAWGAMHGSMLITHRAWTMAGLKMWGWAGRLLTLTGVMLAWVLFRATTLQDTLTIWKKMFGLERVILPVVYRSVDVVQLQTAVSPFINGIEIAFMAVLMCFCMTCKNVHEVWADWESERPKFRRVAYIAAFSVATMFMLSNYSRYIYHLF